MGADREEQARSRVGMVLNDKWTLERLIGIGGMASVYAARHRNGAKAAVKVLHPDIGRVAEVLKRFLREGKAANSVKHREVSGGTGPVAVRGQIDAARQAVGWHDASVL